MYHLSLADRLEQSPAALPEVAKWGPGVFRFDDAQQSFGRHADRHDLLPAGRASGADAEKIRRRRSLFRGAQQGVESGRAPTVPEFA